MVAFPPLTEIVPVLQTAIGPVILVSGIGLLLLSMTNRLGRAIDRARILHREFCSGDAAEQPCIQTQLQILWNRANVIRLSVILASFSMLLAIGMTITLFLAALLHLDAGGEIMFMFIGCLLALFLALLLFIYDINQSLAALKVELKDALP
jgi:hypothetical protein